jgi:hypothetical protein
MQISVPVTFDSTNQTMSVSDSSLITFPQNTSDFSIVNVNGTACITPITVSTSNTHYVKFTISSSVEEVEFDGYFSPSNSSFNLWFELKSDVSTQYALVYYTHWRWWNPDDLSATVSNQHWYTVKIVNNDSIKIYDKDTGTLVHSRSFSGKLQEIRVANFYGSTTYLANLVLKRTINTEIIRYANTAGIAEIWANVKNWVLAHIGNGTLTINVNGQTYTFKANQATDVTINIPRQGGYYGIDFYGITPYGGEAS